jgi:hypothetical protein
MKVAILLRGQPRYFEYGATYFNKFIRNYNNVDYRIFIHSWDTKSKFMTSLNQDEIQNQSFFALDQIESSNLKTNLNKFWNPSEIQIESNIEMIKLAKEIIDWNFKNDVKTKKWLFKSGLYDNLFFPVLDADIIDETNKVKYADGIIRLSHFLSQYYSSGACFEIFKKYSIENSWIPDVLWLSRQDVAIRNDEISNIYRIFEFVQLYNSSNLVFVNDMNYNNSREYITDFNFFIPNSSGEKFLGNIKERLFNLFTKDKLVLLSLIKSGPLLCHMIWTRLTDNGAEIHRLNPTSRVSPFDKGWEDRVIRPGIENFDPNEITFQIIKKVESEFKYPKSHACISNEERNQVYSLCI